jgi:hypothetical protein
MWVLWWSGIEEQRGSEGPDERVVRGAIGGAKLSVMIDIDCTYMRISW